MDTKQIKIVHCPKCGAECQYVVGELENNLCPFCGHEIVDYSEEKNQEKIKDVKRAEKKVLSAPKLVAITVISTFLVLIAGTALFFVLQINATVSNYSMTSGGDKYTKKMAKCYEKEDWDGLYDLVILECENSINSPYYFTYRTAWILSCYPDEFDAAYEAGDYSKLEELYDMVRSDYAMRSQDLFGTIYKTVDEVENRLVTEYERETKIMNDLEDR